MQDGLSIRALAREAGCHASTILRRIRRIEQRRDDPLVDRALEQASGRRGGSEAEHASRRETEQFRRILRRLCENGAMLLVSEGMAKAIVVRQDIRTAVLDREIAERMAMNGWLTLKAMGRMRHYAISAAGREVLRAAARSKQADGPAGVLPRQEAFQDAAAVPVQEMAEAAPQASITPSSTASGTSERSRPPMARASAACASIRPKALSGCLRAGGPRRTPFLSAGMVAAAERLREDYELSQLGPRVTQNWDGFLTSGCSTGFSGRSGSGGSESARNRVTLALRELGPGMGDLCLRVCCFLEGIECTERRLGWSARSGKIVLKLALMRLEQHYNNAYGSGSPMIG
ncbi:DUF6456 domain-containing protein [Paracoccus cavernae]|uniref:DUF6456 domain-containing protein n=1 Tax=Paracoccus cavernae TaxID=1571207 RepID=A0ABT8D8X5_9RHOB|nr:DUF6456 domain-containing protein [Paracoccus cavernae]